MTTARFSSIADMQKFYTDSMKDPNRGFRLGQSGPLTSANPRPLELTDRVFHPPVPAERGFRMGASSPLTTDAPIRLTNADIVPRSNLPMPVERGFTMGEGSFTSATRGPTTVPALRTPTLPAGSTPASAGARIIDTTATAIPKTPRTLGPAIEGMGDFAPYLNEGGAVASKGLRGLAGAAGRGLMAVASHPLVLATTALKPLANAQSAATANSNGPVLGLRRGGRTFGMAGGPRPGEAFSTNAISYSDPGTGNPVAVPQSANQTAGGLRPSIENPTPGTPEYTQWQNNRNSFFLNEGSDFSPADPTPQAAAPAPAEDPHGYAIVDGKRIAAGDIGTGNDPALKAATSYSVNYMPADQMPGAENVGLAVREAQRQQAAIDGGGGYKTMGDYTGGLRSASGEGAAFALRYASGLAAEHNRNIDRATETGVKQQELGLKQQELGLGLKKLQIEEPYYKAHANLYNGMEADRVAKADREKWLMSPEGQAFTLRSKGKDIEQETEHDAQKAYTDVIAKGGDPLTATNAYVGSKGLRKGEVLVPGTPAVPEKGSLFWKKAAQPATAPLTAPPEAVAEYNNAIAAAGDDTAKKALIDARFRATYGKKA